MATEWTARTVLRAATAPEAAEVDEQVIAFRDGQPTPMMLVLLEALAPFADARRAVADALSRFAGPWCGGSS